MATVVLDTLLRNMTRFTNSLYARDANRFANKLETDFKSSCVLWMEAVEMRMVYVHQLHSLKTSIVYTQKDM